MGPVVNPLFDQGASCEGEFRSGYPGQCTIVYQCYDGCSYDNLCKINQGQKCPPTGAERCECVAISSSSSNTPTPTPTQILTPTPTFSSTPSPSISSPILTPTTSPIQVNTSPIFFILSQALLL